VAPEEAHMHGVQHPAAKPEERAPGQPQAVMLRVAIESKLGLGPSDPEVGRPRIVEPAPGKRARRRRRP
jgi:hypothetical protein